MAATQPILAGTTLAYPSAFSEEVSFLGTTSQTASEIQKVKLVATSAKRLFTLNWTMLTNAERNTIVSAFTVIKQTIGLFLAVDGNEYIVARLDDNDIKFEYMQTAGGTFRYNGDLKLQEVASVVFVTIAYDPAGDDILGSGEYAILKNIANGTIDLTGWKIWDSIFLRYTFPAFTLAAGASVTVYTKAGADTADTVYMNRGTAIWNNVDGDTGELFNRTGILMDTYIYVI